MIPNEPRIPDSSSAASLRPAIDSSGELAREEANPVPRLNVVGGPIILEIAERVESVRIA